MKIKYQKILSDKTNSMCIQNIEICPIYKSKSIHVYSNFYDDILFRIIPFYKPITKLFFILLFSLTCNAQEISKNPYQIAKESHFDYQSYVKLRDMKSEFYNTSYERDYDELMAVFYSRYGKYKAALTIFDKYWEKSNISIEKLKNIVLVPMSACIDSLIAVNKVIMINETHFNPRFRSIGTSILQSCYENGYRYLAVEALNEDDTLLNHRKYPLLNNTGFYCNEPLFGDFVRQALIMGYKLIPYDAYANSSLSRDELQADNIINRTLDVDSNAKILVYGGMGHICDNDYFYTMGKYFKAHSGINPLTIDFTYFPERYSKNMEGEAQSFFLDIADSMKIREPLFMYDTSRNKYYSIGTDITAILPRTHFSEKGIPDWKLYNDKITYQIKKKIIDKSGIHDGLISARLFSEGYNSVPVDQIEFNSTDEAPSLVLYKGKYLITITDGKLYKRYIIKVN